MGRFLLVVLMMVKLEGSPEFEILGSPSHTLKAEQLLVYIRLLHNYLL